LYIILSILEKIKEIYMRTKIIGIFLSCILILLSFHCREQKKPAPSQVKIVPETKAFEGIPSVCILDIASVKSEPTQKGIWISSLALAEKVTWLGEEKVDAEDKNTKYFRIRLSDGKEGWVTENCIATDAKPAVAIRRAVIYLRPDLVTITNKEFVPMEFIAVSKLQNEWCEAKGQEGKKTGWINSGSVSLKDEDISVALLAKKALAETSRDKKKEKINAIIKNPSFANSLFIDTLKYCLTRIPPWDENEPSYDESEDTEDSGDTGDSEDSEDSE
jgi:SH3-like domain-containing protein